MKPGHFIQILILIAITSQGVNAVAGNWGDWTDGPCSVTCGNGLQNRTRLCNNPPPDPNDAYCAGDGWNVTSCNKGVCAIQGFELTTPAELLFSNTQSMTYTSFMWTQSTTLSASAVLINDNNVTIPVLSDNINHVGSFNVTSDLLTAIEYGVYHVQLTLTNDIGLHVEDLALYFEEPIVISDIRVPSQVLIGSSMTLTGVLSSGTNVAFDWIMNDNDSAWIECQGQVVECTTNYTYTTLGVYNITVVAFNEVSTEVKTNIQVTVLNPVEGFNLTLKQPSKSIYNGNESINLLLTLDLSQRLPMGNLSLRVSFGDGDSVDWPLNGFLNTALSTGYNFSHVYLSQGDFNITASVTSGISVQMFSPIMVRVWDNILNLSLSIPTVGVVAKPIEFKFANYRLYGFEFRIQYGDGLSVVNQPGVFSKAFNSTPWTRKYSSPNIYQVVLNAWNQLYQVECRYNITIQNPITNLTITPSGNPLQQFPYPDGIIAFTITQVENVAAPTDVTCFFSFENNVLNKTGSVSISYAKALQIVHTYTTEGTKNINITCVNLVSQFTLLTKVYIKQVTLNDYVISYPYRNAVNMSVNNNNVIQPFSFPVRFDISLFSCVRFPNDVSLSFSFGDGTATVSNIVNFQTIHTFTKRGVFTIVVTVNNSSSSVSKSMNIKIGQIDFSVDKYVGSVGLTDFVYNISGPIDQVGIYTLNTGSNINYTLPSSNSPVLKAVKYRYGNYFPHVVASFPNFTEVVYLDNSIYADYNLSLIEIEFNATVHLPPGDITVNVSKNSYSDNLPDVKCIFDFGDLIDRSVRTFRQDITDDSPIVFNFTYITLGFQHANITCYNNFDRNENVTIITVYNECFPLTGIFDRQYSNETNPLIISTSDDVDLASRMPVLCAHKNVIYEWKMYRVVNHSAEPFSYNPPVKPNGSIRFKRGLIPEGVYRVTLNVSLPETYVYEPTYVKFIKSPPIAFINGGSQRQASLITPYITLDAFTNSYDLELGFGGNNNLTFSWSCKRATANSLEDLSLKYKLGSSWQNCSTLINSTADQGKATLELMNMTYEGYVVTVNVSVGRLFTPYTQLILVVPGSPPIVFIQCELNCMAKYGISSKSIWNVTCKDCVDDENLSYQWRFWKSTNSTWEQILDVSKYSLTGTQGKNFAITSNVLLVNTEYKLTVDVTGNKREGVGVAALTFVTNLPPYGGRCEADPRIGNASTTSFAIKCVDWLDEGKANERNSTRDRIANNPLRYQFLTEEKTQDGTKLTPFQFGGEMTATEIKLPTGDKNRNYSVDLRVHIYDEYGDYTVSNFTVTVIPPASFIPKNPNDVTAINSLFNDYETNFARVEKGGNIIALMRLMDSTASINADTLLPTSTTPDISTPMHCVNYTDHGDEKSDVKDKLTKKSKDMVDVIDRKISDVNVVVNPSDAVYIAKSLGQIVANKALFTGEISKKVAEIMQKIIKNVKQRTKEKRFPLVDVPSMRGATKEIADIISKTLNFWKTAGTEDLEKEENINDVEEFFRQYYMDKPEQKKIDFPTDEEFNKFVQKCFNNKKTIRQKQLGMSETTKNASTNIFDSVNDALETTAATTSPGEGEQVTNRKDLTLSVEKDGKEMFLNKSVVSRRGMTLQFDNDSLSNITNNTNMELQVTVYEKSPLLHAVDASKVQGQVVNIAVKDENGEKIQIPLNMKIQNEGVTHFKEYTPYYDPQDPDQMMYFRSYLPSKSDTLILYLRLDEETKNIIIEKTNLYELYAKGGAHVSSTVHDFKTIIKATDFELFGYKVFIKGGVFQSAGDISFALKAIEDKDPNDVKSRRKRSASLNDTFSSGTNATQLATANISLGVVTTGCRVYDNIANIWKSDGCTVLEFSNLNETVCRCQPGVGSLFSLSFAAPNMIDFSTVWSKFDPANAAVYATLIALLVIYFILVVILRRKDKTDTVRSLPTFLCDNQLSDEYFYMVAVHTGLRPGAGTKSNVCFIMAGESHDSGVRLLSDGERQGFDTNSVSFYIMSTSQCCGDLNYIRVWHDNSGDGNTNSWYLHKIVVTDLQTDERFVFHCDKWFALDMDDGMIDRIIPVVSNKEIDFDAAFSQQSRTNVTENHLWLSLVVRPQKNSFTRVQRLTCLLMLLFLTMITNAMFFKSSDDAAVTPDTVQIGSLRLSLKTLYVSFVGCLITVPPIFVVTYLFRNASAKMVTKPQGNKIKDDELRPLMTIQQHNKFPHWVVYIAWFVAGLSVVTSAFFLLLYSMQWGKPKAEEWLTTFILSFIESVFLVDPFKVIIVAVIIAFIMRKPVEDEKINVDLDAVRRQARSYQPSEKKEFIAFRLEVLSKGGPPPAKMMKQLRHKMLLEKEAKQAFTKLILHIIFVSVLFCISYINRDQRGYSYKAHIDNILYDAPPDPTSNVTFGFSQIGNPEDLFKWANKTLIPMYYPTAEYNGKPIGVRDTFFISDMTNLRLGLVRLRQVKVKADKCFTHEIVPNHFCAREYKADMEETSDLCKGCTTPLTTNAWKYTSAKDIWGIPVIGHYNTYGGGGYIQSFDNIKQNTQNILEELFRKSWIDRLTRAVFVEFALYNANINGICYSIFLVEFPETGGAFTWVDTQCFKPTMIASATGVLSLFLYTAFLIMMIARIVTMIKGLHREKLQFFKNFWNILDICLVLLCSIAVGMWITKFIFTKMALDMYYNDKKKFINFQHIVVWEYAFNTCLGFLVFLATIRISSALSYNKRITEIAYVLKYGSKDIAGFGVQFLIVFFAFVGFGYLMFGIALMEYRNLFVSFGSLLNTLIGRNTLSSMQQVAPGFAEFFFFVYVFFVSFTLLTMFAAILNNSILQVRNENNDTSEAMGVMDVLTGTFTDMLSLVGIHRKRANEPNKTGNQSNCDISGPVNTVKVMDLMRDTLSEAIGDGIVKKRKAVKRDQEFLDALLINKSLTAKNDDPLQACTLGLINIEFDGHQQQKMDYHYL